MKLAFTGGHHNSALELARYMRDSYGAEILWLGHRHTTLKDTNDSAEYQEVIKEGIRFKEIKAGKLYKTYHPIHLLRIPYGFLQAFISLVMFRPDMIVSFGGYLAVPVVLAGFILGIPSVTHEQTTVVGLANKVVSIFAKRIFITWPSSAHYFKKEKIVISGLPLRESIFKSNPTAFSFDNSLPILYITAGKQGSHLINTNVQDVLPELLAQFNIIHQCGSTSEFDDLATLEEIKESLPLELKDRYEVRDYIFQNEIGAAYGNADLILCRAGAHTIYELAALEKPAIIIPISWVSHNEQLRNAQVLEDIGAARILEEKDLTPESLAIVVTEVKNKLSEYSIKAKEAKNIIQENATETMSNEIVSLLR